MAAGTNRKRCYVGNLPPKRDNVEAILRSLFGHHGTIDKVLLLPGRNFGFITFTTEEAAQAMIDAPRPHLQSATGPYQLRVGREHERPERDLPRQGPEPEAPAPRRGHWRFRDRDPDDNLLEQLQDAGARLRQRGRERDAARAEGATLQRERDEALRERDAARKQLAARNEMLAQVLKEQQY